MCGPLFCSKTFFFFLI
uniref:2-phytyl-1 4-beta-naphthoquinone methyltransferaseic n=1 Tax=Rhizophora mucronata TaxID=61149 RepID=A0A2P2IN55_RHIMU